MTHAEANPSPAADGAARAQGWLENAAGRWLHADQLEPDPALVAQGWERRFITDGGRAEEVVDLYQQLGFEVRLEPVLPAEIPDGCNECQLVLLFHFQTVYTRRSPSIRDGGAEPLPSSPGRRSGVVGSPG